MDPITITIPGTSVAGIAEAIRTVYPGIAVGTDKEAFREVVWYTLRMARRAHRMNGAAAQFQARKDAIDAEWVTVMKVFDAQAQGIETYLPGEEPDAETRTPPVP